MRADFSNQGGNSFFGKKGGVKHLKEKIIAISAVLVIVGLVVFLVWPEPEKVVVVPPPVELPEPDTTNKKGGGPIPVNQPVDPKNGVSDRGGNPPNQNPGQGDGSGGSNGKNTKPPGKNNNAATEITASPATSQSTAKADYNSFNLRKLAANGVTQFSWPGTSNGENLEYQFEIKCSGDCSGNDYTYSEKLSETAVSLDLKSQLRRINNDRTFRAEVKIYGSDGKLKKTIFKDNISLQCNPE
jgi:hypothetical protein